MGTILGGMGTILGGMGIIVGGIGTGLGGGIDLTQVKSMLGSGGAARGAILAGIGQSPPSLHRVPLPSEEGNTSKIGGEYFPARTTLPSLHQELTHPHMTFSSNLNQTSAYPHTTFFSNLSHVPRFVQ